MAAVDTHVAKHIVKHCLLDLLKHKTRVIVTENRFLIYHANQVLHVDGTVRPSDITSEDYDDDGYMYDYDSSKADVKVNDNVEEDRNSLDSVMLDETKEFGTLSSHVLTSYWKSTGGVLGCMVLLSLVLMQLTRNLSDAWLAHWVSTNTTQNATDSSADTTEFYLKVYTSIAVINSAITLARAFMFAYAGIKAAKFIHNKLLNCVFYVSSDSTCSETLH